MLKSDPSAAVIFLYKSGVVGGGTLAGSLVVRHKICFGEFNR